MSDVPQGPDWWRASNGLYYPPEATPGERHPDDGPRGPGDDGPRGPGDDDFSGMPSPPDEPAGDQLGGRPGEDATVVGATGSASGWGDDPHAVAGDPTVPGVPAVVDEVHVDEQWHDDEPPARSRGWLVPVIVLALVVAALVALGVWWLLDNDSDDESVTTDTTATTTDTATTDTTDEVDTTETTPTTENTDEVSVFEVGVGDCFDTTEVQSSEGLVVTTVVLVDCAEPHRAEVYAIEALDADDDTDFPGAEARDEAAQELCEPGFEDFVGIPLAESELVLLWLAPTEESWADGDREVTCAVAADDDMLTGSMEGAER